MYTTLAAKFRQEVSKSKDFRMKTETVCDVGYSTGFLNFDFMNGTVIHVKSPERNFKYYSVGIPSGSICMVIGRSGCGKTTWAIQAASNIVRPFKTSSVFHDDIEGGITEPRKEFLTGFKGEELRSKFISRNTGITAENFYERMKMIHDEKINNRELYEYDTGLFDNRGERIYQLEPTVYVLDSIAMLMPEKFTEEEELSGSMSASASAKVNSSVFKRITPMMKAANIILIMINHINDDISINPMQRKKAAISYLKQGETLSGGKKIVYLPNIIIRLDDVKLKETEGFGFRGSLIDISLTKSRSNCSGLSTQLVLDMENGFDPDLSLFMTLKNEGVIKGAGVGQYFEGCDIKFSQKNFKEKLYTYPELREAFIKHSMAMLKSWLDKIAMAGDTDNSNRFDIMNCISDQLNAEMSA